MYKQQFENYYDLHYSHYELTLNVSIKTNVKKEKKNNFTQLTMQARESCKFNIIVIYVDFELQNYFNAFLISFKTFQDILKFWKNQQQYFSKLFAMIKNVLVVSCVEVEVERLFNLARNVIIYHRDRLNVDTIETIMIIKFAVLKKSSNESTSKFTNFETDEFYVNELLENRLFAGTSSPDGISRPVISLNGLLQSSPVSSGGTGRNFWSRPFERDPVEFPVYISIYSMFEYACHIRIEIVLLFQ